MIHFYDLRHGADQDDWELGLRVASALYAENVTEPDNFIKILKFRHRWVSDRKGIS